MRKLTTLTVFFVFSKENGGIFFAICKANDPVFFVFSKENVGIFLVFYKENGGIYSLQPFSKVSCWHLVWTRGT